MIQGSTSVHIFGHVPLDMDEFSPAHEHDVSATLAMGARHETAFLLPIPTHIIRTRSFL